MTKVIGIDLGTSNSAAAVVMGGKPTIIPAAEGATVGGKAFPSVVAFSKEHALRSRHPVPVDGVPALPIPSQLRRSRIESDPGAHPARRAGEHAVADNRRTELHSRGFHDDLLQVTACLVRALEGRRIGKLHPGVKIALVLFRQKAAGHLFRDQTGPEGDQEQKEQADDELADEPLETTPCLASNPYLRR